jgi:hypothetical protein
VLGRPAFRLPFSGLDEVLAATAAFGQGGIERRRGPKPAAGAGAGGVPAGGAS